MAEVESSLAGINDRGERRVAVNQPLAWRRDAKSKVIYELISARPRARARAG